ncbi:transposable element Tc3 transposase [Trichonephila clavipes]|uniref:Transposable element Tc3 transposase n=1 Tax=Trichonephila clavipes TaxID=2585209 RepID=A0A8X6UW64_TRICX|nr:transposable element Tc3 transposase [Trichonephila clavipes]
MDKLQMNKEGLRDNCVLHHDNASSHTALIVFENLVKMGVETLLHPPYRPDSLPGNFFLFYGIKITRKGSQLKALRVVPVVHFLLEKCAVDIFAWSFGLAIHQNDHQARRRFVEWAQNEIAVVPDFHKRILFSDEAHFWLNGYVNKQNCRIRSDANPQVHCETPLHPEKLTFWCALWAGGIIGPYFFKNDEGHNELWFQQDGTTCHTARATIDLLKDTFGDRLISRFGPVNWPPRSCDLTPLDYFLWGYVKSLVYVDKPQRLDHLEDNICRVIADIRPQMLEKVIENWTSRLDYIRASRGSPMPEIIFKM